MMIFYRRICYKQGVCISHKFIKLNIFTPLAETGFEAALAESALSRALVLVGCKLSAIAVYLHSCTGYVHSNLVF